MTNAQAGLLAAASKASGPIRMGDLKETARELAYWLDDEDKRREGETGWDRNR